MGIAVDAVTPRGAAEAMSDAAARVLSGRIRNPFGAAIRDHQIVDAGAEVRGERVALAAANDDALAALADGDATQAVERLSTLLTECVDALGADHPDTLVVRGNLAATRLAVGQAGAAVTEAETLLADRERVLGPHHPSTVNAGLTLGMALLAAGETEAAQAVLDTAMSVIEHMRHGEHRRHRPDDHPLTRFCRSLLAEARASAASA